MDVRARMINAGILIIDKHGKDNVPLLFPIFESYLNKKVEVSSRLCLFIVLNTPSEAVQRAVSDCLSPLMVSKEVIFIFHFHIIY